MHARLGEVLYMAASTTEGSAAKYLAESIKRFSRSIELCDDYLRGYYGLKLVRKPLCSNVPRTHSDSHRLPARSSRTRLRSLPNKIMATSRCHLRRRPRS